VVEITSVPPPGSAYIFWRTPVIHDILLLKYKMFTRITPLSPRGPNMKIISPFKLTSIIALLPIILFLTQCDLVLGSGEDANVGIDLGAFYGSSSRAITGVPPGISITGFKVSVFGPGMNRIEKTLSVGTRYINMSVPSGKDRFFTVEAFFRDDGTQRFPYLNLRSYKGRAVADLRPGKYVGLPFNMVAGSTQLLAPDRANQCIFWADQISTFTGNNNGLMGSASAILPYDLDIAADGRVFIANDAVTPSIVYGSDISSRITTPAISGAANTTAIAMDRDCRIGMTDRGGPFFATNILYMSNGQSLQLSVLVREDGLVAVSPANMNALPAQYTIQGLAVDPWTHRLFIVGSEAVGNYSYPFIMRYNPTVLVGTMHGEIESVYRFTTIGSFYDVIVKDNKVFVLNNVSLDDQTAPILIAFDKDLHYQKGFGTISSYDPGSGRFAFQESVAPGKFYHPKRFIAQENEGLYIIDDSDDYDKIVYINENLDTASWRTFPAQVGSAEPFGFIEYIF
jgi:hypothetical protein